MALGTQNTNALPGVSASIVGVQPREIWYGDYQTGADHILPGFPLVLDGTKVNNASNAPYTFETFAGTFIGQQGPNGANPGKYAPSILGLTTAAYAAGSTSLQLDVPTATMLVGRQGTSGTFAMVGPATATTVGAVPYPTLTPVTFTYSAVNAGTGVVTVTAINQAFVLGSMVLPTDGSQYMRTIIGNKYGLKSTDWTNINQIDVLVPVAYQSGILRTASLYNYPADPASRNWVKQTLRLFCAGALFNDDFEYGI